MKDILGRVFLGRGWGLAEHAEAQLRAPLALPAQVVVAETPLRLRLMAADDGPRVLSFASTLPAHDLLFLRRDITRPDQVEVWLDEVAKGMTTTVLALRETEVVGYASVVADGLAWTRHVRELRVMVAPSMRRAHLGRLLTVQAFAIAKQQGAKKMVAQMTADQTAAVEVFRSLGFETEARLHHQVMDRDGQLHDLQIMGLDVDAFQLALETVTATVDNALDEVS